MGWLEREKRIKSIALRGSAAMNLRTGREGSSLNKTDCIEDYVIHLVRYVNATWERVNAKPAWVNATRVCSRTVQMPRESV